MAEQQRRISELYTYLAAAYDGQDFPEVYSHTANITEFVANVNNFRLEAMKDQEKVDGYLKEIKTLQSQISSLRSIDQGFANKYGVSLKEYQETYAGTELAQMDEYLRATGKAQALHLNAAVGYLEKVDEQAKKMLDGWDRVEKNARTQLILDAVVNAIDIISGIGLAGAGVAFLYKGRDLTKSEFTAPRLFWDLGTNGGDALDLVSVALNTYNVYDNLDRLGITKKSSDVLEWIQKEVNGITGQGGNFDRLVERLKAWVKDENKDPGDPNPFIPV
jgi:hypothetical protein